MASTVPSSPTAQPSWVSRKHRPWSGTFWPVRLQLPGLAVVGAVQDDRTWPAGDPDVLSPASDRVKIEAGKHFRLGQPQVGKAPADARGWR